MYSDTKGILQQMQAAIKRCLYGNLNQINSWITS